MRSPLASLRALWGRREHEQPEPTEPAPRPSYTKIAVLEHQLLGISPEPGTSEAMAVEQATPIDQTKCPHDDVIDVTELGNARPQGMCERCGASMVATDDGSWRLVGEQ